MLRKVIDQFSAIDQLLFFVTVGFIKISIVLFNKRLTGLTSTKWMVFHNIFLGFLIIFVLTALFVNLFACDPPLSQYGLAAFGKTPEPPVCVNSNSMEIALNLVHIITDFGLLMTPLVVLFKIRMATSQKIRLMLLFSVGLVSCIGSVMRQISNPSAQPDLTCAYPYTYLSLSLFHKLRTNTFQGNSLVSCPGLPSTSSSVSPPLPSLSSTPPFPVAGAPPQAPRILIPNSDLSPPHPTTTTW